MVVVVVAIVPAIRLEAETEENWYV